ncbi:TPA: outer membrane lipoprotein-sorting protein [Methanosarcina acetivorans]|uniref:Uncharacterized protein n=2 Tax=Methanosarcina acetivorans TaxID=2214 RepID=Q8TU74_METAC|nr:outer membrane lipoprotein-sorting protein [Methanosarcina acetivorans]AAM03652.1 conserved hypothetical protein [Methanosarcina acetivorans C2A]HIH95346.1 outer membrane lipoprotein-sorting protein [Methanosarcina acetivorans]
MSRVITTKELKSILVLAFIAITLFASGCTEENLSAEEIATQMMDKQNSIQDYSYTMYMTSYTEGQVEEIESKFMFKKPNKFKEIMTESGKDSQITVSDGEISWSYNPDANTVIKMKPSEDPGAQKGDYIYAINEFLDDNNVTLLRTENVDGRATYLLNITPKEIHTDDDLKSKIIKIWVDKETWMPLRWEYYNADGNLTDKNEIRDLKVNTGIPDSEFKFEIPDSAKIIDLGMIPPYEELSLEEARNNASFKILTPEYLPDGYKFNYSIITNNSKYSTDPESHYETVELVYAKEGASKRKHIILTETVYENLSFYPTVINGTDIQINEIEGKCFSDEDTTRLIWRLGDINLLLGTPLEKNETLKIAESISEKL